MLPLERQQSILQYLKEHNVATVSTLATHFQVHEATIRRDLISLVKEGHLKRTHGGVMMEDEVHSEPSFQEREPVQLEEKIKIGKRAAEMIQDGENIILDSGTTTVHIAKSIFNKKNLTVITNDINIAAILRSARSIKVIVTGGILFPDSYMLNGMITDEVLQTLHVHKAFIGTPALHHQKGLTHFDEALVSAKRGMIRAAKHVFVVADHTKIGSISLHTVASPKQIHDIITGKEAEQLDMRAWEETGVQVHLV
ncbi:DeoR/GlpR family DNA-binding transcription regulator [Lederbergia sp. NSJ-179]|uniref:DeoR/GlpR family DNA-binding transcription regulator n=1 Tax=Lederbergia sp. NSJ-179 TaxID=2931402 RepID=UPI001FD17943|nr:DeoR/GlpR family DNA-binding transcription regulator [Lederbergia sp. NSJ-179]MCJ7840072.1 DeoR/GlpR family DNA-binding transcription regulator [Lederbergia sp. NSJ-179]